MGDVIQLFATRTTVVARPCGAPAPRLPIDLDKVAAIAGASARINALARYIGAPDAATIPVIRDGKYECLTRQQVSAYASDLLEARTDLLAQAERERMPARLLRAADRCIRAAAW